MRYGRTRPRQRIPLLRYIYLFFVLVAVVTLAAVSYQVLMTTKQGDDIRAWAGERGQEGLAWLGVNESSTSRLQPTSSSLRDESKSRQQDQANSQPAMGYIVKEQRPKQPASYPIQRQTPWGDSTPELEPSDLPPELLTNKEYRLPRHLLTPCLRNLPTELVTLKYPLKLRMEKLTNPDHYTSMTLPAGTVIEVVQSRGEFLLYKYMDRYGLLPTVATDYRSK